MRLQKGEEFDPLLGRKVVVYRLNGEKVTKARYEAALPKRLGLAGRGKVRGLRDHRLVGQHPTGWPMESIAMAVHRKQIGKAIERDKKRGAPPTEYTRAGLPIWTSPGHKRAYCKALGVHDNNAFS